MLGLATAMGLCLATQVPGQAHLEPIVRGAQQRVVKVYGAGGLASLEHYQSGFLVSDAGHVATAWSYVLDVEPVVVLDDGRRFEAEIVGFEPTLELAVLKIDAETLPYFSLQGSPEVQLGTPVLAVSNLFGIASGSEPASVMRGSISSIASLSARRGTYKTTYEGKVYLLDLVANNPGAAGGALVNTKGELIGMLGKELRDEATGVWLNYALPAEKLRTAIADIVAGRQRVAERSTQPELPRDEAHTLDTLGLVFVPDVLEKTPVYLDAVQPDSPAAAAGLQADDLILLVDSQRIDSQRAFKQFLRRVDRRDAVQLTIQRGNAILPMTLKPSPK